MTTETLRVPDHPPQGFASPRAIQLARIVKMLSSAPDVRSDLAADIRAQVDAGTYLNEEKLDLAIYRMLKDILE